MDRQRFVDGTVFERIEASEEEVPMDYAECWHSELGPVYRSAEGGWWVGGSAARYRSFEQAARAMIARSASRSRREQMVVRWASAAASVAIALVLLGLWLS